MRETPETDKIAAQAKPAAKIDELIAELCPDGVEYRNLYDIAHFNRGQVITAKAAVNGGIPVVAGWTKASLLPQRFEQTSWNHRGCGVWCICRVCFDVGYTYLAVRRFQHHAKR